MTASGNFKDRRKADRFPININTEYEFVDNAFCPCKIYEISSQGLTMDVNSLLKVGDMIKIVLNKEHIIPSIVVRVDENTVGVKFDRITDENLNFILDLKT